VRQQQRESQNPPEPVVDYRTATRQGDINKC